MNLMGFLNEQIGNSLTGVGVTASTEVVKLMKCSKTCSIVIQNLHQNFTGNVTRTIMKFRKNQTKKHSNYLKRQKKFLIKKFNET